MGLAATFALTSCASIGPIKLIRRSVHNSTTQTLEARVLSVKPLYVVAMKLNLGGGKNERTGLKGARILAAGSYRNWSWVIHASPAIVTSWHIWEEHAQALKASVEREGYERISDWKSGIQKLYGLTEFLLGDAPLPMRVEVYLVPPGKGYKLDTVLSSPSYVPLKLVYWYPTHTISTAAAQEERSFDFRETLALIGGLLEHVELAAGRVAAPSAGNGRAVKDYANSACWNFAVRPALVAGSTTELRLPRISKANNISELLARTYEAYPNDSDVRRAYAAVLLAQGAQRFLQKQGMDFPRQGTDIRGLNALLSYCRAFLHYRRNVLKYPMPLDSVKHVSVFPLSHMVPNSGRRQ